MTMADVDEQMGLWETERGSANAQPEAIPIAVNEKPAKLLYRPGPEHFARIANDPITQAQLRIPRRPAQLRSRTDYRRAARWLELEARRGYPSAAKTLEYANNMRWAAEIAGIYGPGTWTELRKRVENEAK